MVPFNPLPASETGAMGPVDAVFFTSFIPGLLDFSALVLRTAVFGSSHGHVG